MNLTTRKSISSLMVALMTISGPAFAKINQTKSTPQKAQLSPEELEKLIRPHNAQSIPQAARFLSLAIQAWNPSLRTVSINALINSNIQKYGVVAGLINPALALIDISFASGRPEFGNLLNPMIAQVAPEIGISLYRKFGMATDYEGRDFDTISQYGNGDIWTTMTQTLGGDFYAQDPEHKQQNKLDPNQDLATQVFQGRGSYFAYRLSKAVGQGNINQDINEEMPTQKRNAPSRNNGLSSTPGFGPGEDGMPSGGKKPFTTNNRNLTSNPGQGEDMPGGGRKTGTPKGPFTNRSLVTYQSCLNQCYKDAMGNIVPGMAAGATMGIAIGTILGGAGAVLGGPAGTILGGGLGVAAGVDECRHSKACNGGGGDTGQTNPSEPKEPKSNPDPKQPKEPKEPKTSPKPDPKPHPSPEPNTAPDPTPEDTPKPHPDKTPPESSGQGDENGDDDSDDKDDKASKSISQGMVGKGTLQIPGLEKKPIQIRNNGTRNPINSSPSYGPRN